METVDDLYELGTGNNDKDRWILKESIRNQFCTAKIELGDKVYLDYRNSKYSLKNCSNYLNSIGCTLVRSQDLADKIIISSRWEFMNELFNWRGFETKPEKVHSKFLIRLKVVESRDFYQKVRDYIETQKEKFTFDFSNYETIWDLLNSGSKDNIKLAAIAIKTCNWDNYEFLLHFLIAKFFNEIRSARLSEIPGWSEFANSYSLSWKGSTYYFIEFLQYFKKDCPSQDQIQLIHKLLNK